MVLEGRSLQQSYCSWTVACLPTVTCLAVLAHRDQQQQARSWVPLSLSDSDGDRCGGQAHWLPGRCIPASLCFMGRGSLLPGRLVGVRLQVATRWPLVIPEHCQ